MTKNISKKIKSLLILSLCCSIIFESSLLIGNAEQTNNDTDIGNEISNTPTDLHIEEETKESTDNSKEDLDYSIIVEDESESIEEDMEIIEGYPGIANMGSGISEISSLSDAKIVNLSNPNAIGSGSVINTEVLNVRSGPSTSYDKLGTLKKNENVEILGTSSNWYKIDFNGKEAYVSAAYLKLNVIEKGIDVSYHNGTIDWASVKKAGVSYAIIRVGHGKIYKKDDIDGKYNKYKIDSKFHENMKGALDAGIKVGVYYFSYAETVKEAEEEAKKCLEALEPYKGKLTYPVFFDYEYSSVTDALNQNITITKDLATNMAKAFLNKIKSNGYLTGLYTNTDFSSTYFHNELIYSNHIWHAQYNTVNTFNKPYSMWQYSDKGTVSGIKGAVDLNYTTLKSFGIELPVNSSTTTKYGITTANLKFRTNPSTSATLIDTINNGSFVEILDSSISGWYKIKYNGKIGYASNLYITITEYGITTANLKFRTNPSTSSTLIDTINNGSLVEVLEKNISGWHKIKYNGKIGYASNLYITIGRFGLTTANLKFRTNPSTSSTLIDTINNDSLVEILDSSISGWYKIRYKGKTGYASNLYINIGRFGLTTANLKFRTNHSTSSTLIDTINNGALVEILDSSISGWYKIRYKGKTGYASSLYIK